MAENYVTNGMSLIDNQDDDVRARHPNFDDDGDGIGGASGWPVD